MSIFDKIDFGGIGGAVTDIFGAKASGEVAKGYAAQAAGFRKAGEISGLNREVASQAAAIQGVQADRDLYKVLGGQRSDVAAAGLGNSGSALDVIRDSAQQGSLTKQLLGRQSAITDLGYQQEAESFNAQAASADASQAAAKKQKKGGLLSGIIKGIGAVAPLLLSDETLKQDVTLKYRRPDGVGIYTFRYRGQATLFEGVMAQDVQRIYPDAVRVVDGSLAVDYTMIGVEPRVAEDA